MGTDDEDHVYGTVPRSSRPLFALVLGIVGVVVIAGGLVTNWLTDTPIRWGLLVSLIGVLLIVLSIYLWIRLSD